MVIVRNSGVKNMINEIGNREIIAYGAGKSFEDFVVEYNRELAGKIRFVIDNDKNKSGIKININEEMYSVCTLDELPEEYKKSDRICFCITSRFYDEIIRMLDSIEIFDNFLCYICWPPLLSMYSHNELGNVYDDNTISHKIPSIIHYCWFGRKPLPELEKHCVESWKRLCPDYEIMLWNEDNYDVNVIPYTKQAYEAGKYSFVSDYARLDILYRYGGIYFDTDVELIKRPDFLLQYNAFFAFEYWNLINTGLGCGCIKEFSIIKELRDQYNNRNFINEDKSYNMTSCPEYHTEYFKNHSVEINNKTQIINDVIYLASDYLCPINQFTALYELNERTLGIHKFSCSWFDEKEKKEWDEKKYSVEGLNKRIVKDYERFRMHIKKVI